MRDDISWEASEIIRMHYITAWPQSSTIAICSIPHLRQPFLSTKPATPQTSRFTDSSPTSVSLLLQSLQSECPQFRALKSKNLGVLSIKSLAYFLYFHQIRESCYQDGNTIFSYFALKLDHSGILLWGNKREVQFILATVCLSFSKGYLRGSARLSLAPRGEMGAETEQEAGRPWLLPWRRAAGWWCCCRLVLLSGREPPSFWMGGAEDRKIWVDQFNSLVESLNCISTDTANVCWAPTKWLALCWIH